ncbi:quinone-dependent dihydroorotate dehydrogenase [Sphingomonas sp.]|uniref:quinone-dependent dihydroorotate dehydrogenase n=1 Tax=Sphingomonas sp. TaxID=28214 RepID=UPI002FC898DE
MDLYPLVRPLLFALDAERAHGITIAALKRRPAPAAQATPPAGPLAVQVAGLGFPNPIGLAAGFDKNAEVFGAMLGLGFGFVEVGTLTPLPQAGNPRPRLFRLAEDRAVINRLGFNNRGQEDARPRLSARRGRNAGPSAGIVGVNIGANKDSTDRIADYAAGVRRMADVADYLTINISSPNTPGLRALQDEAALNDLLAAVVAARAESTSAPPLFLKVAPDLEPADIDAIAKAVLDHRLDALIVSNTTISRPPLESPNKGQAGGLSGAPLKGLALQRLRDFRTATGAGLPLVAAGGVESGPDAYDRIRAGASLVQLYTALIYHGPGLVRTILAELEQYLAADGFTSVAEAVGTG